MVLLMLCFNEICFQICNEQVSHDAADIMKLDYIGFEGKTLSLIDNFLVIASQR